MLLNVLSLKMRVKGHRRAFSYKVEPIHPLLRRSAALAYTRRWWSILAMGAQSAAIDCIFGRDPQVWVPHRPPPLATVLAEADIAPEPSRVV